MGNWILEVGGLTKLVKWLDKNNIFIPHVIILSVLLMCYLLHQRGLEYKGQYGGYFFVCCRGHHCDTHLFSQ